MLVLKYAPECPEEKVHSTEAPPLPKWLQMSGAVIQPTRRPYRASKLLNRLLSAGYVQMLQLFSSGGGGSAAKAKPGVAPGAWVCLALEMKPPASGKGAGGYLF